MDRSLLSWQDHQIKRFYGMVKIRLARGGAKKRPFYHIVVTDVRPAQVVGHDHEDIRLISLGWFDDRNQSDGQKARERAESMVHGMKSFWMSGIATRIISLQRQVDHFVTSRECLDLASCGAGLIRQVALLRVIADITFPRL